MCWYQNLYHAPHNDDDVLHAPGTCRLCDLFTAKQQERLDEGVNFTGEDNPAKLPCPAEERRLIEDILKDTGNWPLMP